MSILKSKPNTENRESLKKGDIVGSQAQVYVGLSRGHYVFFYEEGDEGTPSFKIEIAIDPVPKKNFYLNYDEILKEVSKNSRGRKYCLFNL